MHPCNVTRIYYEKAKIWSPQYSLGNALEVLPHYGPPPPRGWFEKVTKRGLEKYDPSPLTNHPRGGGGPERPLSNILKVLPHHGSPPSRGWFGKENVSHLSNLLLAPFRTTPTKVGVHIAVASFNLSFR